MVKENEYQFFAHNVNWLQQVTTGMNELYPAHLLSFFGHYGVSIFLFLSAFGLEQKYELASSHTDNATPPIGFYRFTRYHFLKLFKMMIAGFVAFIIVDAITAGSWRYRAFLVLWIDVSALHCVSIVYLSSPLGLDGWFNGGMHSSATIDGSRRRVAQSLSL